MNGRSLINNLPQTTYCERGISTALLAEPINAFSNLAFLIAGYFTYRLLKKRKITSKELWVLAWLLGFVGVGSFAYHTARNSVTLIFDAFPIYLFILFALFLVLKELFESKLKAVICLISFTLLEVLLSVYVPKEFLNGSVRHLVAIIFICFIGGLATKKLGKKVIPPLVRIVGLYALAIFFRSIDTLACPWLPVGTHFLWHVLAAVAGYYAICLLTVMKLSHQE